MTRVRSSFVATASLLVGVGFGVYGWLVWSMTTTADYGRPGHFTRSVQHQVYPHRAEALWLAAGVLAAVAIFAVASPRSSPRLSR
jgi:hypothetical protein